MRYFFTAVLAFVLFGTVHAQEQLDWSPFFIEDRIIMTVEGVADISTSKFHLKYAITNLSGERVALLLIRPDGRRWELALGPRQTELLVVDAPLELTHPTPATTAFSVQTYLTVYEEDRDERVLVPAEITSFAFAVPLQDGARILSSSIPREMLNGEAVADRKLRALPAVQVVLTTAPERVEISTVGEGSRALAVDVRNFGRQPVTGLVLTALVETTAHSAAAAVDPWRLTGDDGVMLRWEAALPKLDGGAQLSLDIPGVSANEASRLHRMAVHNSTGDLVAVY